MGHVQVALTQEHIQNQILKSESDIFEIFK